MTRDRPCLFITGTDTGVGKTTICRALLSGWRKQGRKVTPLKPIETGCGEHLRALDAEALARAAGTNPAIACLSRWAEPLCPQAASRAAGRPLARRDIAAILSAASHLPGERLLVEGAGGLLVPIAPDYTMADLIAEMGAYVLIVARSRLGTINHTLLTLSECRRRALPLLGVILSRDVAALGPDDSTNAGLIGEHGRVPVLGPFPHCPDADDEELAVLAAAHLDLDGLWQRWTAAT